MKFRRVARVGARSIRSAPAHFRAHGFGGRESPAAASPRRPCRVTRSTPAAGTSTSRPTDASPEVCSTSGPPGARAGLQTPWRAGRRPGTQAPASGEEEPSPGVQRRRISKRPRGVRVQGARISVPARRFRRAVGATLGKDSVTALCEKPLTVPENYVQFFRDHPVEFELSPDLRFVAAKMPGRTTRASPRRRPRRPSPPRRRRRRRREWARLPSATTTDSRSSRRDRRGRRAPRGARRKCVYLSRPGGAARGRPVDSRTRDVDIEKPPPASSRSTANGSSSSAGVARTDDDASRASTLIIMYS